MIHKNIALMWPKTTYKILQKLKNSEWNLRKLISVLYFKNYEDLLYVYIILNSWVYILIKT